MITLQNPVFLLLLDHLPVILQKLTAWSQHERPKIRTKNLFHFYWKTCRHNILENFLEKKKRSGMPVNALLWRAALDIASFVPLDDVDTFGGSIVTEWYAPDDQPYRRLKLAVFVVGLELRSDAIQVRAYVQVKSADRKSG